MGTKQLSNRKTKNSYQEKINELNEKLDDYFDYILKLEKTIHEKREKVRELQEIKKEHLKRIKNMKAIIKKKGV